MAPLPGWRTPPEYFVGTPAASESCEQAVATPLEQQMSGVDNMLYMQSTNANDGSMTLTVTFDVDTNPNIDQVRMHGPNIGDLVAITEEARTRLIAHGIVLNHAITVGKYPTNKDSELADTDPSAHRTLVDVFESAVAYWLNVRNVTMFNSAYCC